MASLSPSLPADMSLDVSPKGFKRPLPDNSDHSLLLDANDDCEDGDDNGGENEEDGGLPSPAKKPRPARSDASKCSSLHGLQASMHKRISGLTSSLGQICDRADELRKVTLGPLPEASPELLLGTEDGAVLQVLNASIQQAVRDLTGLLAQRRQLRSYAADNSKVVGVAFVGRDCKGAVRLSTANASDAGAELALQLLTALFSSDAADGGRTIHKKYAKNN
eukprot:gene32232-38985_t